MENTYLFGTDDFAARRLELLARVFAESTRAFLRLANTGARIPLAVDLGCGPGLTTNLIADTLDCGRVVGLDAALHFIELARSIAAKRVAFSSHDVCAVPFPCGPADLIFCRFLLTHLQSPEEAVAKWGPQLNRNGLLMIEEVEAIQTDHPVLAEYIGIVAGMLASNANRLYAGRILAAIRPEPLIQIRNDLRSVPVDNVDAAAMFSLNLKVWKDNDFIRANYSAASIARLERALQDMADGARGACEIHWEMRQSIFARE